MTEYLEFMIDKFTFRIAADRYYTNEGLWVKPEDNRVRIGISDYLQQRSGDVAFIEFKPIGSMVANGEELVVMETIKVNISLSSPVTGRVIELNPAMESSPEIINQDPYAAGWMVVVEAVNLKTVLDTLLDAETYLAKVKRESEREVNKD